MHRPLLPIVCLIAALALPFPAFAEKEPAKPKVDWIKVESTGVISSQKEGALEKTLWQAQKRSDIEFLIQRLPTQGGLFSVVNLQRRLLLSAADTKLIDDDIGPMRGNDLLIQRINKLMDMGLYDDAWELYTQKAEDTPYDVSIAQLGMLLMVMRNDLATACLEEKVFASKYPSDKFFKVLDAACARSLGMAESGKGAFTDSAVLQSVYNDKTFTVSAGTPEAMAGMNHLERALVLANGKIRYDGLTAPALKRTPSSLIGLYLMDKALPESARGLMAAEMHARGLAWHSVALSKETRYKRAKDLSKDTENQWPVLESAMKEHLTPGDRSPYAPLLVEAEPAKLSTETLVQVLGALLAAQQQLPEYWLRAAQQQAPGKPIIYIYLHAFRTLTPTPNAKVEPAALIKALQSLKAHDSEQILAIFETLDPDNTATSEAISAYEKQSGLTLEGNYVMPSLGLNVLLETAPAKKQIGITVLAALNALAVNPDNMYSGTVSKALGSLYTVGLIEDAKQIGGETVASVLNKY